MNWNFCHKLAVIAAAVLLPLALRGQSATSHPRQLTITVNPDAVGIPIPDDFLGLSFETADVLPKSDGTYPYFRASNYSLVNLFHTLGIKSLRIGGNTSDRPSVAVPDTRDIDQLFGFAKAADTKVIYTLRLHDSAPAKDAPLAKYLEEHYSRSIACLVIGNEPDVYEKQYSRYRDDPANFSRAFSRRMLPRTQRSVARVRRQGTLTGRTTSLRTSAPQAMFSG